jgi:hypothetical protein
MYVCGVKKTRLEDERWKEREKELTSDPEEYVMDIPGRHVE